MRHALANIIIFLNGFLLIHFDCVYRLEILTRVWYEGCYHILLITWLKVSVYYHYTEFAPNIINELLHGL